jgi:nucleoid-associated protein YgaU
MSGTSKAIVSICVLLLASLVVYYGMTPPQASVAQQPVVTRPTMFGGDATDKLVQLGFPPIAADLAQEKIDEKPIILDTLPLGKVVFETVIDTVVEEAVEEVVLEEVVQSKPIAIESTVTRMYTVLEGETLGEIASRELGSYKMWREIATLNSITDPSSIMPGRTLRMPQQKKVEPVNDSVSSSLQEGKLTHQVQEGETMSSIAGDYYDDVNKYYRIVKANPSVDPARLQIGMVLVIPED